MGLISVIIPAYNRRSSIGDCIESALAQTSPAHEIIVVDDGSTDGTPEVVTQFGDKAMLVRRSHQGVSAARNTGIRSSTGEWIAFLDTDDLWRPHKLARQQEQMQEIGDEVGCLYSRYEISGQDFRRLSNYPPNEGDLRLRDLLRKNHIGMSTSLVRRSCIDKVEGFDEELRSAVDWDLWLRLAGGGVRFAYCPEVLARYRVSGDAISVDLPRWEKSRLRVLEKFFSQRDIPSHVGSLRPMAYAWAYVHMARRRIAHGDRSISLTHLRRALTGWPPILMTRDTFSVLARVLLGGRFYPLLRRLRRWIYPGIRTK